MTQSDPKVSNDLGSSTSSATLQTNATANKTNSQSSSSLSNEAKSTVTSAPIITYPEFLIRNRQAALPKSLATTHAIYRMIIYTLNISGVLSAVALAVAHYYVNPMRDALTEARRDFAQHVLKLLSDFNQRMGDMVAARGIKDVKGGKVGYERKGGEDSGVGKEVDSDARSKSDGGQSSDVDGRVATDDKDTDSFDEDIAATEFYQRNIGTQTSPAILSRRSSSQSEQSLRKSQSGVRFQSPRSTTTKSPSENRITVDERHISDLRDSISVLVDGDSFRANHVNEASRQVADLKEYLGRLTHFSILGDERSRAFHVTANAVKGDSGGRDAADTGVVDAAQELKTEIRRLKGHLLSARNFPVPGGQRGVYAGRGR